MNDIEDGPKDWKWQILYFNREVMQHLKESTFNKSYADFFKNLL